MLVSEMRRRLVMAILGTSSTAPALAPSPTLSRKSDAVPEEVRRLEMGSGSRDLGPVPCWQHYTDPKDY